MISGDGNSLFSPKLHWPQYLRGKPDPYVKLIPRDCFFLNGPFWPLFLLFSSFLPTVNMFNGWIRTRVIWYRKRPTAPQPLPSPEIVTFQKSCINYVIQAKPMEVYVPEEQSGCRYHIWRLVTSPPFENFIMLLIVLNTVLLMMKV